MQVVDGTWQIRLDLLREFRVRLIADVVIGKLDVRAAAETVPDVSDDPEPVMDEDAEPESERDDE